LATSSVRDLEARLAWLVRSTTTAGSATTTGAQRRMTSISIGSEFHGSERGLPSISMSVLTCNDAPG
jgi:hypothetical protein